ncbi:potassium channel family protein [Melissospora conviva]|uniref:potassium channel family protein n=1 Tax=Melissospora conviva TaxID=3388432 RepID=UPI003B81FB47
MAAQPGSAASDEHDRRRTDRYGLVRLLLVASFLLIGFFYAACFAAVARFQSAPLFADGRADIQYFSFVTMATLGYGDLVPAGEPARTLAVLDTLTGQIFLVTLVARLVSIFGMERGGR